MATFELPALLSSSGQAACYQFFILPGLDLPRKTGVVVLVQAADCVCALHNRLYHLFRDYRRQPALTHQPGHATGGAHRCSAADGRVDARKKYSGFVVQFVLPLHVRLV